MDYLLSHNPDFDFASKLSLAIKKREQEGKEVFGLSPLSSLPSSMCSTPRSLSRPPSPCPTKESMQSILTQEVLLDEHAVSAPPEGDGVPTSSSLAVGPKRASHRVSKKKVEGKARRKRKRIEEKKAKGKAMNDMRRKTREKHVEHAQQLEAKVPKIAVASTGYVGRRTNGSSTTYALSKLVGPASRFKMTLVEWDGRKAIPIVDSTTRKVMILLGGIPDDPKWNDLQLEASDLIEAARPRLVLQKGCLKHRRGRFPAMPFGISHGGGQPRPKVLNQHPNNHIVLQELVKSESLSRISGFANGLFQTWQPRLYNYYAEHLQSLLDRYPDLHRTWPNSVWAATSINFGPRTICRRHNDWSNLPWGWCGITALGRYDYTKGGHIIFWDLGLVVEFPPGSTIFITSAALEHGNAEISIDETRYSITQYSAGGLFRWVDYGFQTVEDYFAALNKNENEAASKLDELADQLSFGLLMLSTLEELQEHTVSSDEGELARLD